MKHKWIILVCIMTLVLGGIGSSTLRKKNFIMGGGPGDTTVGTAGGGSWLDGGAFTTDGPVAVNNAAGITSDEATVALFDVTPTKVNFAGNAAVDIGKTGLATTVKGTLNVDEAVTFDTTLEVAGNINANGGIISSTAVNLKIAVEPVSGTGVLWLDANPLDGTSTAQIRIGRNTDTSGSRVINYYKGDGTATVTSQFNMAVGSLQLDGILQVDDDTFWTGDGSGIPFGSMYNDNTDTTVTMGTSGTAVRIPSGFIVGQTNLVTFQNDREFAIIKAGRYKISWSISFNTLAGSNQDIEGHIGIDNAEVGPGSAHRFIGTATDKGNMGGNAILDLAAAAVVSLMIVNDTGTNDVNVNHSDLVITMVGGT